MKPGRRFDPSRFRGMKVTVMGLGLFGGGAAVTRFLCRLGAEVTVTDSRDESRLASSLAELDGYPARMVLGRHRAEDFSGAQMVVASPAVPPWSEYLDIARSSGAEISSEMNLFFEACKSRWIAGITGSNGKSTTTALAGEMIRACGLDVRVGGNIGKPLIEQALDIGPEERVVLEISSFQLEDLDRIETSPRISAVTNVTPNHLDRHKTMESYVRAKEGIFRHQGEGCAAVLNHDDPVCRAMVPPAGSKKVFFSLASELDSGITLFRGAVERRAPGSSERLFDASDMRIPGLFNVANAMAAAAVAIEAGASAAGIREAVRGFGGIRHRLQMVGVRLGARWYNDSIATTPESVIAALEAIEGDIVWIAGGYDKKLDYSGMCSKAARRVSAAVLIGQTAPVIASLLRENGFGGKISIIPTLEAAVELAAALASPGSAVLLSPGCASYDMFVNFEQRGDRFTELALALPLEGLRPEV